MGYFKDRDHVLDEKLSVIISKEPEIRNEQLTARFGCSISRIQKIRKRLGIKQEPSEFITEKEMAKAASYTMVWGLGIRFGTSFVPKEKT